MRTYENHLVVEYPNHTYTKEDYNKQIKDLERLMKKRSKGYRSKTVSWSKTIGNKWLGFGFRVSFHKKGVRLESKFMISLVTLSLKLG